MDYDIEDNPSAAQLEGFLFVALYLLVAVALASLLWRGDDRSPADGAAVREIPICPAGLPEAPAGHIRVQLRLDRELLADFAPGAEERGLLEAWRAYNRQEAASGGARLEPALTRENRALAARMVDYATRHGREAYVRLGVHLADALQAARGTLEEAAWPAGQALPAFVDSHPTDARVSAFLDLAGNLLAHAEQSGLFPSAPLSAEGEIRRHFLLRLVFKVRWLLWIRDHEPIETGLTRFEATRYLLWKARRTGFRQPERMFRILNELGRVDPTGHHAHVFGCQYMKMGLTEVARRFFVAELASHPAFTPARRALEVLGASNDE
jgi:hypothetical protein